MSEETVSNHARALSKRGAIKGGKARAARLTGKERSEIAQNAAAARWYKSEQEDDQIPWAIAEGKLNFFDRIIPCAVLENGKRVIAQQGVLLALGRSRTAKGGTGASKSELPAFLSAANLKPFISDELIRIIRPIIYKPLKGGYTEQGRFRTIAFGCDAEAFPRVLQVYVDADNTGALVGRQKIIADNARKLLKSLENVAMIALVDEATDYESIRPHQELQKLLAKYVRPEHLPWVRTVPIEFTKRMYQLWGWDLRDTTRGPRYISKLIRKYIYEPLPDGVLEELDRINPSNVKYQRRRKHWQHLTPDMGLPHFNTQLASVMTLARAARNRSEFEVLFERAFGQTLQLEMNIEIEELTPPQMPLIEGYSSTSTT